MKKFQTILVSLVLIAFSLPMFAQKLPDLKGRVIRAATENAYTPLNFVDTKTGKGIGWEYDAMEEICKRLNCKIEWSIVSWDAMINAVRDKQFDIAMDGITINEERKKQVDFSKPYMTSMQFMLVRAKENRFKTPKEFASKSKLLIGAQAGTTNFYTAVYEVLDGNEKNPRIKLFETFGATVQALKSGDVDMTLMDRVSANGYIGANPGAFKVIGDALGVEQFGFILPKGSDLLEPINLALESLKNDAFLDELNQKWFFDYYNSQN